MAEHTTLVSVDELRDRLNDPGWIVVDCRSSLADPTAGKKAYDESHIPGARFANMEEDLSAPVVRGRTGRHPLPAVSEIAQRLGAWGIDDQAQVVAYDASNGSMAARLWWLLQWLGHPRVAVLDGGLQAWTARGLPVTRDLPKVTPKTFTPRVRADLALDANGVERVRTDNGWKVLDARSAERFRGENETIDPVAGRIPGAHSAPWLDNVTADGRFRAPAELRERYQRLLGGKPTDRVVCYCGSGVTAAHDVLALAHAGFGLARLYPGSWSEWITDPSRPVATG